ncbi:DUF6728 family protein [Algoriphagus yeomjeoni]|uniref:DUF5808 domain-containing protein n=1 Tax=Algoriphagus yeomjeoni TaxID=291403 RepID=A0A327PDE0_9BACT|nr:DUF6728 family protein [Algoriphagus yeomjeoni]RAI90215.1 hypothetical protein LV83_02227 [Algoriphagus yeomjeoni]
MSDNNKVKDFFKFGDFGNYFLRVFQKPDPNQKSNYNLRMMHGINKISIVVFLLAIIFWVVKRFI